MMSYISIRRGQVAEGVEIQIFPVLLKWQEVGKAVQKDVWSPEVNIYVYHYFQ